MRKNQLWSHIQSSGQVLFSDDHLVVGPSKWEFAPASPRSIRRSPGYEVANFRQLVHCVAELAVRNPLYYPLFRGQTQDYPDRNGASKLYPSIFRPTPRRNRLDRRQIKARFSYLSAAVEKLKNGFKERPEFWQMPLTNHRELWWALLQHYELAATPLLDLTQSLRMAATFALSNRSAWGSWKEGILFVLGLPHAPACLSPMVNEQLVIVRLQSVCPPDALRPHFQEGYLMGRWPLNMEKRAGDNAAYRLIGKYRLNNSDGKFWDKDFQPIPENAVYPSSDRFPVLLRAMLASLPLRPD